MDVAWFQSRYDKTGPGGTGADYINCPLDRDQYEAFIDALLGGGTIAFKDFEKTPYFNGCLPIEVMAERGRETLRPRANEARGPDQPARPDGESPTASCNCGRTTRSARCSTWWGFRPS